MSHEIRNPINSIVGMTNLLYDTQLSLEQVEYVNTLQYSADLLHALVSDVLDISKIEQGKMEPQLEDFDFWGMAKAMCKTFEFRLSQRPIEFQCEIAPEVPQYLRTDPTFLNQILLNLINNSFKFTKEGYIHCMASTKISEGQNWIEFTIADTGMGISPEQLPFIFERFNQAGKAKRTRDGAGLGLPITKQLVELLGGKIDVQSTLGSGSKFRVLLPFEMVKNPVLNKVETGSAVQHKQSNTLNVLIVEDNPMNRRYLENLLSKWGLTYIAADDGLLALQATEKEVFDLILMDIRMPNLDGYETTLRLRNTAQNANQQVPIIALTASALLDEKVKALQAGMNHHLSKPFTPEQLQEVFRQFFPGFSPQAPNITPLSLNSQELAELYEGDERYMHEIFEIFVQTIPGELAQMRQLLETEDWKTFAAKAHKIKPSFQMVGLGHLSTRAEQLERAKREFDPEELIRDFVSFEAEVLQGLKLVRAELATLS
jgi:CheY-like chemotaxis protein